MKHVLRCLLLVGALMASGCYHARIETGLAPSAKVIDHAFVSSWVYGLVPPKAVQAAEECGGGVSMVETELSFVNQLVGALTFGIYTPMHIKVTCAEGTMGTAAAPDAPRQTVRVPQQTSEEAVLHSFEEAADLAVSTRQPVLVRFE